MLANVEMPIIVAQRRQRKHSDTMLLLKYQCTDDIWTRKRINSPDEPRSES